MRCPARRASIYAGQLGHIIHDQKADDIGVSIVIEIDRRACDNIQSRCVKDVVVCCSILQTQGCPRCCETDITTAQRTVMGSFQFPFINFCPAAITACARQNEKHLMPLLATALPSCITQKMSCLSCCSRPPARRFRSIRSREKHFRFLRGSRSLRYAHSRCESRHYHRPAPAPSRNRRRPDNRLSPLHHHSSRRSRSV